MNRFGNFGTQQPGTMQPGLMGQQQQPQLQDCDDTVKQAFQNCINVDHQSKYFLDQTAAKLVEVQYLQKHLDEQIDYLNTQFSLSKISSKYADGQISEFQQQKMSIDQVSQQLPGQVLKQRVNDLYFTPIPPTIPEILKQCWMNLEELSKYK